MYTTLQTIHFPVFTTSRYEG